MPPSPSNAGSSSASAGKKYVVLHPFDQVQDDGTEKHYTVGKPYDGEVKKEYLAPFKGRPALIAERADVDKGQLDAAKAAAAPAAPADQSKGN